MFADNPKDSTDMFADDPKDSTDMFADDPKDSTDMFDDEIEDCIDEELEEQLFQGLKTLKCKEISSDPSLNLRILKNTIFSFRKTGLDNIYIYFYITVCIPKLISPLSGSRVPF